MNERIFKIALEAMDFHGAIDIDTELKLTNDQLEKFARLIVRECVGLVNEQLQHNNSNDSLLALKIKEHFGVEE